MNHLMLLESPVVQGNHTSPNALLNPGPLKVMRKYQYISCVIAAMVAAGLVLERQELPLNYLDRHQ
jgi:hypothetical protein